MLLLKMVINDLDLCYCLRKLWRTVEFLRGGGGSVASKEKLRDDAGSSSRPLFRKTKGKTARRCQIFFSISV
ncbi:hypothetical protein ERO13_A04G135800v2 [Gossypium hirsutum]|uniref:Uncharacterized protein n=1 Tax=Gossypium mustelinum TaxID=34275 RepID=A0A5D2ZQ40_GOSMU|nr:hypothetical protein ERO13_A04G135800v2 [Gossypium hirsutum]TYJ40888.1 hypothetical protein E1A91_A04G173000v1 [Gossypium mustelinum]TYJ40889.1 hypothetical protein E1A91_A04G173000v1 [Gossypium mustelinum]TYJ40891.1 hypothetical protein E1A91_A04G173000v1 [Gossypium mustelinum]TYJ40893.1 hypothetical protein E1A91_A04G173000v1 [Gossypium mustelinum]